MPLYAPYDVLVLNWSERVGGGSRVWDPTAASTQEAVRRAARQAEEEARRGAIVVDPPGGVDDVGTQEVRAYGLLLEGDAGGAVEVLGRVLRYELVHPVDHARHRRASEIRALVQAGQRDDAVRRLREWRRGTLAALGVTPE